MMCMLFFIFLIDFHFSFSYIQSIDNHQNIQIKQLNNKESK